ncbi:hypothetical protein CO726_28895 [Bacillus fungorum]|uniref:Uncharacterized protein n=1 Tax=Bacillus fungorum TaxID=2039284 RepID=A0A2G6Q6I5_9BACI|nr:hypothetical protein CO726_28895 [Bacillus fungorum]
MRLHVVKVIRKKKIDEERKKSVFTQNSNVIFNSSFLADNAARKEMQRERIMSLNLMMKQTILHKLH